MRDRCRYKWQLDIVAGTKKRRTLTSGDGGHQQPAPSLPLACALSRYARTQLEDDVSISTNWEVNKVIRLSRLGMGESAMYTK